MILIHLTTNQFTLGRVYTRDPANKELYVQHYQVANKPIESYCLKNTQRNLGSKGSVKYTSTTVTSAILKYHECHLHDAQHLVKAN